MSKRPQVTEAQAEKKNRQQINAPSGRSSVSDQPPAPDFSFRGGSVESQAAMLEQMPAAQRQAMIQRISQVQGNRHLQRIINASHQSRGANLSASGPQSQSQLTVGEADDQYEQEADQVAENVMRTSGSPSPPPSGEDDDSDTALALRKIQASGTGAPPVTPELQDRIASLDGTGKPLPRSDRAFFENRLGADFDNVRVHTGDTAVQTARDLNAQAYTTGSNVVFDSGEYEPGTNQGRRLLAHELTHVVQQGAAGELQREPDDELQRKRRETERADERFSTRADRPGMDRPGRDVTPPQKGNEETELEPSEEWVVAETAPPKFSRPEKSMPSPQKGDNGTAKGKEATALEAVVRDGKKRQRGAGKGKGAVEASPPAPPEKDREQVASPAGDNGAGVQEAIGPVVLDVEPQMPVVPPEPTLRDFTGDARAPDSSADDPEYQAVVTQTGSVAKQKRTHEPAESEAAESQAAVDPQGKDVEMAAQDQHAGEMEAQEPGEFNVAAFKAALLQKIAGITPKKLKQVDKFKKSNRINSVKQTVSSQVRKGKSQTVGPIRDKVSETPDQSGIEPKAVTPMSAPDVGPPRPYIGAEGAVPKPKKAGELEGPVQENSQALDKQLADAHVTEEQLTQSNEPDFQAAVHAKREAQVDAAAAPPAYRQEETQTIAGAQQQAQTTVAGQMKGIQSDREQSLEQVFGQQEETKASDEGKRAEVAAEINTIYEATRQEVTTILEPMDAKVEGMFDAAAQDAKRQFEDYVDQRMKAYKKKRYKGFFGKLRWLKDKLLGMPKKVNKFYEEGRQLYIDTMDVSFDDIASYVVDKLNEAKTRIAQGRQAIQEYVTNLPEEVQQIGAEAAQNIQSKFDDLERNVRDKQSDLIDTLASKYQEHLQELDARIEELKAKNRGLIAKAIDFIKNVIATIVDLAKMLLKILLKAAAAIPKIILNPIGFLKNLLRGVKEGLRNFISNFGKHLGSGLIEWLTGTLTEAGIQLPEKFDMKGILNIALQVLGISWESIKPKVLNMLGQVFGEKFAGYAQKLIEILENGASWSDVRPYTVKLFGARAVGFVEKAFQIFQTVREKGIAGLWEFIKDFVGDLATKFIMDPLKDLLKNKVIKAGIEWLVSMLGGPAGAFIKAVKTIIRIVSWFLEHGKKLMTLIDAILDSILAVAGGNVQEAAQKIEKALSKVIPVVISFFADLLGIGSLATDVRKILQKIRAPINKAIDWVLKKVKGLLESAKRLFTGGTGDVEGEDGEAQDTEDDQIGQVVTFTANNEEHKLWVKAQGTQATPMIASEPTSVKQKLKKWEGDQDELGKKDQGAATRNIDKAYELEESASDEASAQLKGEEQGKSPLGNILDGLANRLKPLFELFESGGDDWLCIESFPNKAIEVGSTVGYAGIDTRKMYRSPDTQRNRKWYILTLSSEAPGSEQGLKLAAEDKGGFNWRPKYPGKYRIILHDFTNGALDGKATFEQEVIEASGNFMIQAHTGPVVNPGKIISYRAVSRNRPWADPNEHRHAFNQYQFQWSVEYHSNASSPPSERTRTGNFTFREQRFDWLWRQLGEHRVKVAITLRGKPIEDLVFEQKVVQSTAVDSPIWQWIHGALDVLGLLPGIGIFADGANATLYLLRGKSLEASLSLLAMLPFLGQGATIAKRGGIEISKECAERLGQDGLKHAMTQGKQLVKELGTDMLEAIGPNALSKLDVRSIKKLAQFKDPNLVKRLVSEFSVDDLKTLLGRPGMAKLIKETTPEMIEAIGPKLLKELDPNLLIKLNKIQNPKFVKGLVNRFSVNDLQAFLKRRGVADLLGQYADNLTDAAVDVLVKYPDEGLAILRKRGVDSADVLEKCVSEWPEKYGKLVDSNEVWAWGKDLDTRLASSTPESKLIRKKAIEEGFIPFIKVSADGIADFGKHVKTRLPLPEHLWKVGDRQQFSYLDGKLAEKGMSRKGYTWHHHQDAGWMELVPMGLHNAYTHKGGRSIWGGGIR